jgi:hypothetical protein
MESTEQRTESSSFDGGVRYAEGAASGRVRAVLVLVLVGVLAVALWPFAKDAESQGREARPGELDAAVAAMRAEFRGGDAVRIEPSWWMLPWRALTKMGEGSDRWPFEGLLLSEDLDPVEALGHARLLLLSGFGREPALPSELEGAGRQAGELWRGETLRATVWELAQVPRLRTMTGEWERLDAVRHAEGKVVSVAVLVDGVEKDRFELAPHRFWMERRAIRIPPGADPATVAIRVETEDNAWRETMLEADLIGEPGPALRRWATRVVE